MRESIDAAAARTEKTLLLAVILSAPGPLVTGAAVLLSQSATQTADFLRRTAELVALVVAWQVYRRLQRNPGLAAPARHRLERMANQVVGGAMLCSGVLLFLLAAFRLGAHAPGGNVAPGLAIALLGLVTNGWFWQRYRATNRAQWNAVIAGQEMLYRAKTSVDLCVAVALLAVALVPTHPATPWVDTIGSMIVAGYLLWSGFKALPRPLFAAAH